MTTGTANLLMGVRTPSFVVLVSDKKTYVHRGAIPNAINREVVLSDVVCLTMVGDEGDVADFKHYVKEVILMLQTQYGYDFPPEQVLHWVRKVMADGLRSRERVVVECLVGGYNKTKKEAYLGAVDALGTPLRDQNYIFGGEGGSVYPCYSIMDNMYKSDMSVEETIDLLKKCLVSVKKHASIPFKHFSVVVIDQNGVRHLPDIE